MSWKQNNGRDRGHIDGIGYFLHLRTFKTPIILV
jgi:hypothetical protein